VNRRRMFVETSPATPCYNCLAWAAGEDNRWWEPDVLGLYYWPPGAPREISLSAFVAAFVSIGYVECEGDELEEGFQKIAIYAHPNGTPTHAARQLSDGRWTSKLGEYIDIEHDTHADYPMGCNYGTVRIVVRRQR